MYQLWTHNFSPSRKEPRKIPQFKYMKRINNLKTHKPPVKNCIKTRDPFHIKELISENWWSPQPNSYTLKWDPWNYIAKMMSKTQHIGLNPTSEFVYEHLQIHRSSPVDVLCLLIVQGKCVLRLGRGDYHKPSFGQKVLSFL